MYKLQIRDDEGNTTSVSLQDLEESDVTIGRDESNTIRLTDRNVSRHHARLYADEEGVSLEDLSRYGIRVNGRRISSSAALDVDDLLSIGDYEVTLALEGDTLIDEQPLADTLEGVAPGAVISVADTDTNSTVTIDLPRLVVLSRTMAGTELQLKTPEAMVGRTPDNDLVLNHRSISREHARLVWDGTQCSIIDLGSANGTRINGELYDRTVLRRGDMVELGHVTLRYVDAGESFKLDPSMIVELEEGTSRQGIFALVALVTLAAGLGVLWANYYGKPTPPTPTPRPAAVSPAQQQNDAPADNQKVAPDPLQARQPAANAREDDELANLVQIANDHLNGEKWDEAIIAYGKVLAIDEGNQTARGGQTRAIYEQAANRGYSSVNALVVAGDYRGAWDQVATLDGIPAESVYHRRARVLKKAIVASHVAGLLDEGYAALRKRKFAHAVSLANSILEIEPQNRAALSLSKQAAKASTRSTSKGTAKGQGKSTSGGSPSNDKPEKTPVAKPASSPKVSSKLSGKELYKLARGFHNKDPDKAAKLYSRAANKGYSTAWRQLGSLHLQQGSKAKAISAYKKYLDLLPGAPDAEVIKRTVQRLGGTP